MLYTILPLQLKYRSRFFHSIPRKIPTGGNNKVYGIFPIFAGNLPHIYFLPPRHLPFNYEKVKFIRCIFIHCLFIRCLFIRCLFIRCLFIRCLFIRCLVIRSTRLTRQSAVLHESVMPFFNPQLMQITQFADSYVGLYQCPSQKSSS